MAAPNDCGAEGIKNATLEWSHAWYVGVALAMSVAFAMLIFRPARINRDETHPLDEQIALYVYLGFTLRACYLSLGIHFGLQAFKCRHLRVKIILCLLLDFFLLSLELLVSSFLLNLNFLS